MSWHSQRCMSGYTLWQPSKHSNAQWKPSGKYFTIYTQRQPTIVFSRGRVTKDQVAFSDRADIFASIADFQLEMDIASCTDLGRTVEFKDVVKT